MTLVGKLTLCFLCVTLACAGAALPHRDYSHGSNGNLTSRVVADPDSPWIYDAENRLTGVSGAVTATFVYDGDGNRVKATFGSTTTVYVGNIYERDNGSTVRKYYYAGGVRVAMRTGGQTYYLLGDHLGGTNVTYNSSNGQISKLLYKPWGETRFSTGTTPTTWRFTGQREDATIGLYFYNARYLDPQLGRFTQPDTIVPEPSDPQALNRYSYSFNNPLRFVDPNGHDPLDATWQQAFRDMHGRSPTAEDILIRLFSIAFPGQWDWNRFYDAQGNYISGSLENVFRDNRPADWTWNDVPVALESMAGWYKPGEEGLYIRDIGSIFGGLPNRFEISNTWEAVSHPANPIRVWVYVGRAGLPARLTGTSDRDANIHHWAWGLAMGGTFGPGASFINMGREITQFQGNWANSWSDVEIGNRGAALAMSFRVLGTGQVRSTWNRIMLDRWFAWER